MNLKKFYFVGMLLSAAACIYFSFNSSPMVPLWKWFGYRFSIGSPLENWIPKASFAAFLVLYLIELSKKNKMKNEND